MRVETVSLRQDAGDSCMILQEDQWHIQVGALKHRADLREAQIGVRFGPGDQAKGSIGFR